MTRILITFLLIFLTSCSTNENEWIQFLIELIDDSNLRTRIGREAINTVDNGYTVDVLSKKYLNVLNRI